MKSFATVQEDLQLTFLLLVVCYKRKMELNNFSIVHSGSIFAIEILMQGDVVNKLSLIQILETREDVNIMESMHHILWVMDNERYHHLDERTYNKCISKISYSGAQDYRCQMVEAHECASL